MHNNYVSATIIHTLLPFEFLSIAELNTSYFVFPWSS